MAFSKALVAHGAGEHASAVVLYKAAIAAEPRHAAAAHSNVGAIYSALARWEEATYHSSVAAELAPQEADVLYNLANVLMQVSARMLQPMPSPPLTA